MSQGSWGAHPPTTGARPKCRCSCPIARRKAAAQGPVHHSKPHSLDPSSPRPSPPTLRRRQRASPPHSRRRPCRGSSRTPRRQHVVPGPFQQVPGPLRLQGTQGVWPAACGGGAFIDGAAARALDADVPSQVTADRHTMVAHALYMGTRKQTMSHARKRPRSLCVLRMPGRPLAVGQAKQGWCASRAQPLLPLTATHAWMCAHEADGLTLRPLILLPCLAPCLDRGAAAASTCGRAT